MTDLSAMSPTFLPTRRALHLITFYAFSLARQQSDGEVWLTPTSGGFGTPLFDGRVLRFEDTDLVDESAGTVRREPISTLGAALAFSGVEFDQPRGERNDIEVPTNLNEMFEVSAVDVALLASYFAMGQSVLEELMRGAPDRAETTPRLWGEHFDLAIELGSEDTQSRASVGFSAGDRFIEEPYIYVAPWWKEETKDRLPRTEPFGVALRYTQLLEAENPRAEALSFFSSSLAKL